MDWPASVWSVPQHTEGSRRGYVAEFWGVCQCLVMHGEDSGYGQDILPHGLNRQSSSSLRIVRNMKLRSRSPNRDRLYSVAARTALFAWFALVCTAVSGFDFGLHSLHRMTLYR